MKADAHYNRGVSHLAARTIESIKDGVLEFDSAPDFNPDHAEAHAMLAIAYIPHWGYEINRSSEVYSKARVQAMKAYELDPNSARCCTALASVKKQSLDPRHADARVFLAECLAFQRRFQEAEGLFPARGRTETEDRFLSVFRGWLLYYPGRHPEAIAWCEKLLQDNESSVLTHR